MRKLFLAFVLALLVCPAVLAQTQPPPPPPTCANGVCAATVNKQWGYCKYETHQYGRSFRVWLEIGIGNNITDPSTANCFIPLGGLSSTLISGIHGTVSYDSWATSISGMAMSINTNGDGCNCGENTLFSAKVNSYNGYPVTIPFDTMFPSAIPLTFGANGPGQYFVVVFNDDLGKPTTMNVAFSGTFQ